MAIHRFLLHNGDVVDASSDRLRAGQLGLLAGWGVFTTMRVKDGYPFAWERHWARLSKDAYLLNVEMPGSADDLYEGLLKLVEENGTPDCTLRLNVVRNGGGIWEDTRAKRRGSDVIGLTADSKKWADGVRLSVQPHGRYAGSEFAGAKILSWAVNLTYAERAQRAGFDETILLNEYGRVAECTSANIFAVNGEQVRTPPLSEGCLPGITREVLLQEIRVPGVTVVEEPLTVDGLRAADCVFITSTTRDLRRVGEIDGVSVQSAGDVPERLNAAFRRFVETDIEARRLAGVRA